MSRHFTWFHTKSHYPGTGSISPSPTPLSLSAKREAASTIFNDYGMSQPGIEPVTSRSPKWTLYQLSYRVRSLYRNGGRSVYGNDSKVWQVWPGSTLFAIVAASLDVLLYGEATLSKMYTKWARSCGNVSYVICEQQMCRSACAFAHSVQHLCCLLLR